MSTAPDGDPLRVVVVDDTPDLRDLMRMALERTREFEVVGEAENGRDAIEVARNLQPDLVFLDIAMPVMDGLEALPEVRRASPDATIVMLSGFGASEMTVRALESGADGYIQKGQPLSALLAQVRTLVVKATLKRSGRTEPVAEAQPVEHPTVLDHLELAPFGFLQVRKGRIVRANREAGRLLGDLSDPEQPLAVVAPELAEHLAGDPGPDGATVFDLGDPPRQVMASVRRSGEDHVLYLQAQVGDEADLLRRAIATAAHEIRGPVGVLMGVAETLTLHGKDLSEPQRERMLSVIARQTRQLDNITADLLAAGQAQHGTLAMQMEKVDTVELVRSVIDDDFALSMVEDSPAHVLTDPLRFQQMLSNLLSNARKYGRPPFLVRITSQGSQVSIEVEDNGTGVPEDFSHRLFQEYSRAPGTTARGTGLGLFVVRALAEAQGGSITYAPRHPQGSVFTLTLPAVPA
ncbi:MAG: ATP-binding region, ATPase domain protein [Marmoricola sp.]|nr:ATP-binding region, ATPase domain protein [Marmoricola sp.]